MAHLHKVNGILHKKHPSAYPTKSRIFSHSHSHHKPPITVTTHIPFPPSIYLATYPHPIQYKKTAKSQPAPKPFSFLPPPSTPVSGQGQHKKSTKRRTHPSNAKTGKKCMCHQRSIYANAMQIVYMIAPVVVVVVAKEGQRQAKKEGSEVQARKWCGGAMVCE